MYLDKRDTCVTNRNNYKPWIDIFLAIHGNNFICKLLDFEEVLILNTLKQEKKTFWEDVFKLWICFIKTRNSVNVIKSNFHTFPIRYNSEIEANNNTIFIKLVLKLLVTFFKMVDWMHLLESFIYHICVLSSIINGIVCAISTL